MGQTLVWLQMNVNLHSHRATNAQQIPSCLLQKPTESSSLHGSEHCHGSCANRACNPSLLHKHARNHTRFLLHYCRVAQVCTGLKVYKVSTKIIPLNDYVARAIPSTMYTWTDNSPKVPRSKSWCWHYQ